MQVFGHFFCPIKWNFICFVQIDSGYACIRRHVSVQNRESRKAWQKNARPSICLAGRERTFGGNPPVSD